MRVIFLDVDGVITYKSYHNSITYNIDIEKVKLLKQIVENTNAQIVLSSSWKQGYNKATSEKDDYYIALENTLAECNLSILDITDDIYLNVLNSDEVIDFSDLDILVIEHGTGRGAEIEKWINDHNVDSYVILDDEYWDWKDYNMESHWVQSSWYDEDGGLHQEHVEKAIKILNNL